MFLPSGGDVPWVIRNGSNPPVRDLYDRRKERGKHQKVAEVACMRKLLAIVYGCWSNNERFDPTYEKRLKARQAEKKSASDSSSEENEGQSLDMSAPVSRKEAKKRRKATSSEKGIGPSARGQGPSSMNLITANLLLSKLDNQLGSSTTESDRYKRKPRMYQDNS